MVITVGFAAPVTSVAYPGGTASSVENIAAFYADTLESNPTEFAVVLDTAAVAMGNNVVAYVDYSDDQGNAPDMSGLMGVAFTLECDEFITLDTATTTAASRKVQPGSDQYHRGMLDDFVAGVPRELYADPLYDCDVCSDLSQDEQAVLDMYDNGGKRIVCDPTCLDSGADRTHCDCKFRTAPIMRSRPRGDL